MDISSMMRQVNAAAAQRVASGLSATRGNGISTSATSTRGSAATTATSNATTSSSDSSDVSSSDFLTLLVTEMQNQDPTQPTDPNAYIQQLVEVNSLQQLISINGELGGSSSASSDATSSSKAVSGVAATPSTAAASGVAALPANSIFGSQDQVS